MLVEHCADYRNKEKTKQRTDPLEECVEDGAVGLGLLGGVAQSVCCRQQGDKPRGCTLCAWSDVKEKRPAVQLQTGQERTGIKQRIYLHKLFNLTSYEHFYSSKCKQKLYHCILQISHFYHL